MTLIVRGRLDQVMKHIQRENNIDKTEEKNEDFIRTIRMSILFVKHLDHFVRLSLQTILDQYIQEDEDEMNDVLLGDTIDTFLTKVGLQNVEVITQSDDTPLLRIVLARIYDYISDERPSIKLSSCKSIRNRQLRKISHDALIPVLQTCISKCIQECQSKNSRRTRKKAAEGKEKDDDQDELVSSNTTTKKKERKTKRYHCIHLTRIELDVVAERMNHAMGLQLDVCISRCKEAYTTPPLNAAEQKELNVLEGEDKEEKEEVKNGENEKEHTPEVVIITTNVRVDDSEGKQEETESTKDIGDV